MMKRKNPAAVALGKRGARARMTKLSPAIRRGVALKAIAARWKVPIKQFSPPASPGIVWLWDKDGELLEVMAVSNGSQRTREILGSASGPRMYATAASFQPAQSLGAAEKQCNELIEQLRPVSQSKSRMEAM